MNVRHIGYGTPTDLSCGDTLVVAINSRTGSFTLKNGFKFHADGRGHAANNACDVGPAVHPWNDYTRPYANRNVDYKEYRQRICPGEVIHELHPERWEVPNQEGA